MLDSIRSTGLTGQADNLREVGEIVTRPAELGVSDPLARLLGNDGVAALEIPTDLEFADRAEELRARMVEGARSVSKGKRESGAPLLQPSTTRGFDSAIRMENQKR